MVLVNHNEILLNALFTTVFAVNTERLGLLPATEQHQQEVI